jgi:hypothetical protein
MGGWVGPIAWLDAMKKRKIYPRKSAVGSHWIAGWVGVFI